MTTIAPKPDWALSVWGDKQGNLFVQLGDSVLRLDAFDAPINKLLKMVPKVEDQPGYISGRQNVADHVLKKPIKLAKETERKRLLRNRSPESRAKMQEMIRRANIKENK